MSDRRTTSSQREAALRAEADEARDSRIQVLECITDGFVALDRDWRFSYVNAAGERMLEMRRDDVIGRSIWELFPAIVGTRMEREYRRAVAEQVPVEFDECHPPWDRRFHIKAWPAADCGLTIFYRDVTGTKRAEEALVRQEKIRDSDRKKWREPFLQVPAAITVLRGPDHVFESFNEAYLRLVQRSSEDLSGKPVREAIPEAVRQGFIALLDGVYKTGEPYAATEARLEIDPKGDGEIEVVYLNFVYLAMRNEAGEIDGILVHASEVTDLVRTRQRVEHSEERFRAAVESVSNIIWTNSADGKMTGAQPGWGSFTGQTYEEYQGYGWSKAVHPADAQPTIDAWDCAVAERRMFIFEHRVRRRDGAWRVCLIRAVPILEATGPREGEIREWVGVHTDITDQRRAELETKESEERFRTLANNMSQFAWTADASGWIYWYNQRWYDFTGTTLEQMEGWGWRAVHHPDHVERVTERIRESFETGTDWEDTFPLRGKDGEYRWFLSRALPIRDADGRILRWFGTNTDITTQLDVERELRHANADLQQFAYSASHDLQEPLRSVSIYSDLLARRYGDRLDGDGAEFLDFLKGGALRMEMLVKDLLAYTQVTGMDSPTEETDSNASYEAALKNLAKSIADSGAKVTADTLPALKLHAIHLQQLFQNIIGNAVKYRGAETPHIHVGVRRQHDHWLFSVADNGIGIDPKYGERIFGLFKRLHTADEYTGTGIGLAICQRIVERYGGRIWVESRVGEGSTFYFTLPGGDPRAN